MGGITVDMLGDIDGAILGGVEHSEGVALGVAGRPGDTQSGVCPAHQGQVGEGHFCSCRHASTYKLYYNCQDRCN